MAVLYGQHTLHELGSSLFGSDSYEKRDVVLFSYLQILGNIQQCDVQVESQHQLLRVTYDPFKDGRAK
jgi:hypothetical protein